MSLRRVGTPLGELQPLGQGQGRVMPGKVFLDLGGGRGKRRAVAVAIALGVAATGVEAKQAGEEAVEPGALGGGERSTLGEHGDGHCTSTW